MRNISSNCPWRCRYKISEVWNCCSGLNQLLQPEEYTIISQRKPRPSYSGGTLWLSWLRRCSTNQKVAGSIPHVVIEIFHWHKNSGCTMTLGLTQPLTERVPGAFRWGLRRPVLRADNPTTFMNRLSRIQLASTTWNPQSLYRPLIGWKFEGKVTHVQALRVFTGLTAHTVCRGIALLFLYHGTRRAYWWASRPGRSLPPGKTRYPLYGMLGETQAWRDTENLVPTGIRSADRPARSQLLYQLRHPAHTNGIALPLFDATSVSYLFRLSLRQSYGRRAGWTTAIL